MADNVVIILTTRGGDAATQGHEGGDLFAKQMAHLLDEFDAHTRMATNKRVHADQDCTPDP